MPAIQDLHGHEVRRECNCVRPEVLRRDCDGGEEVEGVGTNQGIKPIVYLNNDDEQEIDNEVNKLKIPP